ncbi:MAG: di-trans,poly-cis-decaprenylcistransferase [Gammaproteobacteria bacterium RIFCSPHIGHO2_02_FULL_39_13]|nr:MAG: di-trans,poly-cis-decaprenylcistransferase [Gammaproteobacteria bacterium RIFCSPHIGHO2_02_FULL_39_13]OGT50418.1 MAG: di-trans,poly-cis-decaprenylcistransferase [Gammaproteobacteria bacterium RIFCSPHIGHO2_12_FULL_39_24]
MLPRHVAIVMDGNGRWAQQRFMPRIVGHRAGVKSVQKAIDFCVKNHIQVLSLFALSVENFQSRPESEVQFLISLLSEMLLKNLNEMHQNNIRIQIMGDVSVFQSNVRAHIEAAQSQTKNNTGLTLVIAVNYSGRWDIFQAAQKLSKHVIDHQLDPLALTEKDFEPFLCLYDLPEPDLLIRTSGEQRISNFMLWQFAYTELCFVDVFWPDFNETIFSTAIASFQKRERRFGKTGEQLISN